MHVRDGLTYKQNDTGDDFQSYNVSAECNVTIYQNDDEMTSELSGVSYYQRELANLTLFMKWIYQAIKEGRSEEVAIWLQCIPSGQVKQTVNTIKCTDRHGVSYTALQYAADFNQPEVARLLLNAGAGNFLNQLLLEVHWTIYLAVDPNITKMKDGSSVLHTACGNPNNDDVTELVKLIVDR